MKTKNLTIEQYIKAIELGYYEHLKCISVYKKLVIHYKLCGRTEELIININRKLTTKEEQKKSKFKKAGESAGFDMRGLK